MSNVILSIASIPSFAAMGVRQTLTVANFAKISARMIFILRTKIAPALRTLAIITIAIIAWVLLLALNFLLTEGFRDVKEISETPENFRDVKEISETPEVFGGTNIPQNLASLKVSELRKMAQIAKIPQARNARKAELIVKLEEIRICEI